MNLIYHESRAYPYAIGIIKGLRLDSFLGIWPLWQTPTRSRRYRLRNTELFLVEALFGDIWPL